jgi:hypothetical protein
MRLKNIERAMVRDARGADAENAHGTGAPGANEKKNFFLWSEKAEKRTHGDRRLPRPEPAATSHAPAATSDRTHEKGGKTLPPTQTTDR